MAKRKYVGGYQVSDDSGGESDRQTPSKKASNQPIRLVTASTSKENITKKSLNFNLPVRPSGNTTPSQPKQQGSSQKFVTGSKAMPAPRRTPTSAFNAPVASLSDDEAPVSPTLVKGKGRALTPDQMEGDSTSEEEEEEEEVPDVRAPPASGPGSSRQLLEQRMDDLEQGQIEIKGQLKGIHDLLLAQASGQPTSSKPSNNGPAEQPKPSKPTMTNPLLTTEMADTITRVVSGFSARSGTKEKGKEANSLKTHTRNSYKTMCTINGVFAVRGPYKGPDGHDVYLPEEFANLDGYRVPFPNLGKSLVHQMEWVPTAVHIWKITIPPDNSPLSKLLCSQSDEQIITLIHDGPFRTYRAEWAKQTKKSEEDIELMNSHARQEKRVEQKVVLRTSYRDEVPELAGPKYDWMFHPGMASRDVSDDEGGLVVHRNAGVAQWVTNFNDAVEVAERKANPKSKRRVKRKVVLVKGEIPQLYTGKGVHKKIVRIAACGFSKKFWRDNKDLFDKSTHLVNRSIQSAPIGLLAFLQKYPKESSDSDSEFEHTQAVNGTGDSIAVEDSRANEVDEDEAETEVAGSNVSGGEDVDVDKGEEADTEEEDKEQGIQAKGNTETGEPAGMELDAQGRPVGPPMPPPPPLSDQGGPSVVSASVVETQANAPVKRPPGRPKGSKNKPKDPNQQPDGGMKKRGRPPKNQT